MARTPPPVKLSVIIPAYNEETYLPDTLDAVQAAAAQLGAGVDIEVIVVDNGSDDETANVAREKGARLVQEPVRGISHARNSGARSADGDVLVFIDADVIAPANLFSAICEAMSDPRCVGGAVDVDYRPQRLSMKLYLLGWRLLARVMGMAQGAAQFCRRSAFEEIGGYDPQVWVGEDVDFYWSLKRLAKTERGTVRLLRCPRVRPSSRRFDKWPVWKVLVWTNPLFIALFRHRRTFWEGWHSRPVR